MVKASDTKFIEYAYQEISDNLTDTSFIKLLQKTLTEKDIYHIKENIYNLDFRVCKRFSRSLSKKDIALKNDYSDQAILGILSLLRETLFGLLIYLTYLRNSEATKEYDDDFSLLINVYLKDILNIDEYHHQRLYMLIKDMQADFHEILTHRIEIDDNKDYLKIGADNRI